jgi:hypothetical protein
MAQVLRMQATPVGMTYPQWSLTSLVGGGILSPNALAAEGALEYDLYVVGSGTLPPLDTHRLGASGLSADQFGVTDVSAQPALFVNRWQKRVVSSKVIADSSGQIGLHFGSGPGVTVLFANVRMTSARQTVAWIWREGMAAPAFGDNGLTATVDIIGVNAALPDYCCKGVDAGLDDIRHDRVSGGRLASSMYWDRKRSALTLADISVTPEQRNEMDAIYDVFRRDSVLFKMRAGYPAQRVRFGRPPKFEDDQPVSGVGRFKMSLELLEV